MLITDDYEEAEVASSHLLLFTLLLLRLHLAIHYEVGVEDVFLVVLESRSVETSRGVLNNLHDG